MTPAAVLAQVALLDRVLLGLVSAALAVYVLRLAHSAWMMSAPGWLRLLLAAMLALLALDVQLGVLLLLLGPDGSQDGFLAGDLRLRNVLAVAAGCVVWVGGAVLGLRGTDLVRPGGVGPE